MDSPRTILPSETAKRAVLRAAMLLALACLPGCNIIYKTSLHQPDYYYLNPHKHLPAVGKVVILDMNNDSSYPQISADMTEALFQALQKEQLFSITVVRRTDTSWKSLQLDADAPYTLQQLAEMRKALNCNAVIVGSVTTYQPYPQMIIGLRLKLVDLTDGQLLWAIEQIWDTTDKTMEKRVKDYYQDQVHSGFGPLREQLVLVSSLNFIKFVAYEVAKTMYSN
jgi:hypothetical protein